MNEISNETWCWNAKIFTSPFNGFNKQYRTYGLDFMYIK